MAIFMAISTVLFLAACGGNESAEEVPPQNGSQDGSPSDLMPISKGFEKYSVWFQTSDKPDRKSKISAVYIFEDGKVMDYRGFSELNIEDIIKLTDEEIVKTVKETSDSVTQGKYALDIKLDRLGQSTEQMEVILTDGTAVWTYDLESAVSEHYHTYYGDGAKEFFDQYPDYDSYLSAVKAGNAELPTNFDTQTNEIHGDKVVASRPIEALEGIKILQSEIIHQTIFDTTFSGVRVGDNYSLLTRVKDSFAGFKLDSPDTKSKNVTIEAAKKREEEKSNRSIEEENQQAAKETEEKPLVEETKQQDSKENGLKAKYLQKADNLEAEIIEEAKKVFAHDMEPGFYGQYNEDWDNLLNEVWGILKNSTPKSEFKKLQSDQRKWIQMKENNFAKMSDETASERAVGMDYLTTETKDRTYYLIENYMD